MSTHSSKIPIPFGYHFNPTKEEILSLLRRAIKGEPLGSNPLVGKEIYGENKEPWKLFDKDANKSFWVYTKLKNMSKSRIDWKAGCGCWVARSTCDIKNAHGKRLGFDRFFHFSCKNDESSQGNGHWVLHEYSLSDKRLTDFVICKITNKDAVSSDQQETKVEEPQNKKRKAPEVRGTQGNPNQANIDEQNGCRALTIYGQHNSRNLVGRKSTEGNPKQASMDERSTCRSLTIYDQQNSQNHASRKIPDLNLVPSVASSSHQTPGQPDSTNRSLQPEGESLQPEGDKLIHADKLDPDSL